MIPYSRRNFLGGVCSCSALASLAISQSACTTAGTSSGGEPQANIAPGYRPSAATDEGGLWQLTEKAEAEIKQSRFLVRDGALHDYVHGIACRLAKDYCAHTRLYVMRSPFFNASMMANGAMQVWTGLLLRTKNEAQLAAVIGHEMGHYLQRHSLQKYRDMRAKSNFGAFLGAGIGALSSISDMMLTASMYSFSREQEREADAIGIELMAAAGYAPVEAANVWNQLLAENEANSEKESPALLTATHPNPRERAAVLSKKAQSMPAGEKYIARYRQKMAPLRVTLFEDELRLRQFSRSIKLFEIIGNENGEDTLLAFYTGEAYRLRGSDDDLKTALAAYQRTLKKPGAPPQTYRSLGLLHLRRGDKGAAQTAFREYLRRQPNADDREMILSYIPKSR